MEDPLGLNSAHNEDDPLGLNGNSNDDPLGLGTSTSREPGIKVAKPKEPSVLEKANAGIEALTNTAVGGLGLFTGPLAMATQGVSSLVHGTKYNPEQAFLEGMAMPNQLLDQIEPTSELGKEYTDKVFQFINDVGIPMSGIHGLPPVKIAPFISDIVPKNVSKGTGVVERLKAQEQPAPAAQPTPIPQTPQGTPMQRMAQQLGAPEPEVPRSAMTDMARQLTESMTPEQRAALDAAEQRQKDAQAALEARQRELEQAVKTQATLDRNAAERQRQEAASAVSDAHREWVAAQERAAAAAEDARLAKQSQDMANMHQMPIDDTPHVLPDSGELIAPQYGVEHGIGRVDENGIPIRADRSMEAQNLENPLQRNLWGDELPPQSGQENPIGITQAIDKMENGVQARENGKFVTGTPQSRAVTLLSGSAPLGTAKMGMRRRKQGGQIDINLLTMGVSGLLDRLQRAGVSQPMNRLMGAFKGTFASAALKEAYNNSLDPKSRQMVYLMSPDQFLTLAKRREPWEVASKDSEARRQSIKDGLNTPEGLRQLPYLMVNEKGEVIGHEGRHRAEVLAKDLDKIPVVLESSFHRNGEGRLPFEKLQPQDSWGMPSKFGEPLITPENRMAHDYSIDKTTPLSVKKGQRGALDPQVFKEGYRRAAHALSRLTDQPWLKEKFPSERFMTNSDGTPMVMLHGTTKEIFGDIRGKDEGFHAGFVTSPHIFTQKASAKHGWASWSPMATKENASIHPVVLRKGNYPFLPFDIGNWSPEEIFNSTRSNQLRSWIESKLVENHYSTPEIQGMFRQVENSTTNSAAKYNMRTILSKIGVDGFFYKNSAESPRRMASTDGKVSSSRATLIGKSAQDPISFVTWDNNNFQSIYAPVKPTEGIPALAMRSQRGHIDVGAISDALNSLSRSLNDAFKSAIYLRFDHGKAAEDYLTKHVLAGVDTKNAFIAKPDDVPTTIGKILDPNAKDTPPISDFWKGAQSGPGLTAEKYAKNPLLMSVSRVFNYAAKLSDYQSRNIVKPLEKFVSTLSSNELKDLHDVMKDEMFREQRYTPDQLRQAGMNEKQMQAYTMMREAFDKSLDIQNQSRALLGKKPISRGEAYLSSNFYGDWHLPIKGKDGKLAWYIRTTSKAEGMRALKYLKETMGDQLDIPEKQVPEYYGSRSNVTTPSDITGAYHDMMDFFKDDPTVSNQIREALNDFLESKGYTVAGQNKHFLQKSNIRGFEGDQPWLSPYENAQKGLSSQVNYLNNAMQWANTQKAIADLKQIMSDPKVIEKMPNAVDYAKTVLAKEIGIDSNWFARVENALAKNIGVSRSSLYRGMADLKTLTYLQLLGLSPAHMIATPFQAVTAAPAWHLKMTGEGFRHNIAATSVKALYDTMAGITSHIAHELGVTSKTAPMSKIGVDALKFAEDSGLITKTLFDESRGLGEHALLSRAQATLGWTIGFPEKVARLGTYMSFVHHLEASGKYAGRPMEMFRHAEEYTNHALTSFARVDRPQIVGHLGATGEAAYMFKSFLFNGFNQASMFVRMAQKGHVAPLAAFMGMYALMGGLQSAPLVNELDGAWNVIKDGVAHFIPEQYEKVSKYSLKGSILSMFPENAALRDIAGFGLASHVTGAQLQSRLNLAAIDVEKPMQGMAPIAQEAKEWSSIGGTALHRNKDAALSALYQNIPPLAQGNLETRVDAFKAGQPGPNGQRYYKPQDLSHPQVQAHIRTPSDEFYRQMGMVSLPEARDKTANFLADSEQKRITTAQTELMSRITSAIKRQDVEDVRKYASAYVRLGPDGDFDKKLNEAILNMNLTPQEQKIVRLKTIQNINRYKNYMEMK
jgi:hypothetical protein